MPTKRLDPTVLRTVSERLHEKQTYSEISKELSVSKGIVCKIAKRVAPLYQQAIIDGEWVDDTMLAKWMYPSPEDNIDFHRIDYYSRAGLSLDFIHSNREWLAIQVSIGYAQLCARLKQWRVAIPDYSAALCQPGEICFIRDCGISLPLATVASKRDLHRYDVVVGMLPTSGFCVLELCKQESPLEIAETVQNMLSCFGASPKRLDITLTTCAEPDFKAFDLHYNTKTIVRTAPRKRVRPGEILLLEIIEWVTRQLKRQLLTNTYQVKNLLDKLAMGWNQQQMPEHGEYIANAFLELDRQFMHELSIEPFTFKIEKVATVGHDNHIKHNHHHYSVPYHFIGEKLQVVVTAKTVQISSDGVLVAEHRLSDEKGYSTTESHMYQGTGYDDRQYTPQRLINWAREFGPDVARWAKRRLDQALYPEYAFRSIMTYLSRGQDPNFKHLMNSQCKQANIHGRLNPQK